MTESLKGSMFAESGLDLATFEQDYWQQRACRPGAVDISTLGELDFANLIELCAQPEVESRILRPVDSGFEVAFGPFNKVSLSQQAMLMVQNLESFSYELSAWLSEEFEFIPRWRIEDVMATLATSGGSCGAHFDQYDVFLVQLVGSKEWQVDSGGHLDDDLEPDSEVRLLKSFKATESFTMGPGDVLYIPPGVGHLGIAVDDCITLSVGIRNPLLSEMAANLADQLLQSITSVQSLAGPLSGNQIDAGQVQQLGQQLVSALSDERLVSEWYGRYMTDLRDPELLADTPGHVPAATVQTWLNEQSELCLDLPARIAVQTDRLFVNGEVIKLVTQAKWLESLQQKRAVPTSSIPDEDLYIVQALIAASAVIGFADD